MSSLSADGEQILIISHFLFVNVASSGKHSPFQPRTNLSGCQAARSNTAELRKEKESFNRGSVASVHRPEYSHSEDSVCVQIIL